MCYSAQVWADYKKYARAFGADVSIKDFVDLYWKRSRGEGVKTPKAMDAAFVGRLGSDEDAIREMVATFDAEQTTRLEQELFQQTRRLADAERALQVKETKKALNEQRIAGNKIAQAKRRLATLRRSQIEPDDARIYPGMFAPVMVLEEGKRVIKPMRYQCRPAGKPEFYDRKFPGTYNARRDNLEGFWRQQFGHHHALLVADVFYENIEGPDGNQVLAFTPRSGEPMLIACLWSHWRGKDGHELLSFAAITDEPEPEVAAAGHDRTIINIKPEHVDAWLSPDPARLAELYAIFDDKQHPYYENRRAA